MSWIVSGAGKRFRIMFVNAEGREYWLTLVAAGPNLNPPPLVVTERDDGFLEANAGDDVYSSIDHLAAEHGCVPGEMVSVDPPN